MKTSMGAVVMRTTVGETTTGVPVLLFRVRVNRVSLVARLRAVQDTNVLEVQQAIVNREAVCAAITSALESGTGVHAIFLPQNPTVVL